MVDHGLRWRMAKVWPGPALLGALVLALSASVGTPPAAADPPEHDARGLWLGLSPLAGAYHLSFGYEAPGTSERVEHTGWLNAWALDVGWRFTPALALGVGSIWSRSYEYGEEYEYGHLILRLDWNPKRNWWFVSFAAGMGDSQTPFMETPSGEPFVTSGSAFVGSVGVGGDYAITSWLGLRGRVEFLLGRQIIPSDVSDEVDVNGLSLGTYVVWTP